MRQNHDYPVQTHERMKIKDKTHSLGSLKSRVWEPYATCTHTSITEYRSQGRTLCGNVQRGQWILWATRKGVSTSVSQVQHEAGPSEWMDGLQQGALVMRDTWATTQRGFDCLDSSKESALINSKNKDETVENETRFEFQSIQTFPSLPLRWALSRNRFRTQGSNSRLMTDDWGISIHIHHHQRYYYAALLWSSKGPELEIKTAGQALVRTARWCSPSLVYICLCT